MSLVSSAGTAMEEMIEEIVKNFELDLEELRKYGTKVPNIPITIKVTLSGTLEKFNIDTEMKVERKSVHKDELQRLTIEPNQPQLFN